MKGKVERKEQTEESVKCRDKGKQIETEETSTSGNEYETHSEQTFEFGELPEYCKAMVLSFLLPRDVSRICVVSRELKSIASSDFVWNQVLPPQVQNLLSRATIPLPPRVISNRKKELFQDLIYPTHFDDGNKSFWVDRDSGKLCFMLSARMLHYEYEESEIDWISSHDSSFAEVAQLEGSYFDAHGEFPCGLLSPETEYMVSYKIKAPLIESENICSSPNLVKFRKLEKSWIEFDAGKFYIANDRESGKVNFSVKGCIKNLSRPFSGFIVSDGVKIWPTVLANRSKVSGAKKADLMFSWSHSS